MHDVIIHVHYIKMIIGGSSHGVQRWPVKGSNEM